MSDYSGGDSIDDMLKRFLRHNHKEIVPIYKSQSVRLNGQPHHTVIYKIELVNIDKTFALKVKQITEQEKERELMILRNLSQHRHPNIIYLQHHFITTNNNCKYLNLLTEYMPMNLKQLIQGYKIQNKSIPIILVKLFTYQLLRAVAYLHSQAICHRNIQPENILINPTTFELKLCDFSQAKSIQRGEISISQVNGFNYRAPELLLGSKKYSSEIDTWAVALIIAEMHLQRPLFEGNTPEDVFSEIIKRLGTPNSSDLLSMNSPVQLKLPDLKPKPVPTNDTMLFAFQFLKYKPSERGNCLDYLHQPYLADIRKGNLRLNGQELPNIFNFNSLEQGESYTSLLPSWYQQ